MLAETILVAAPKPILAISRNQLQLNVLSDRSGTATGHDTRLTVGYDWRAARLFPVVEVGYHLTQVRLFEDDTLWWPYTEVVGGLRF